MKLQELRDYLSPGDCAKKYLIARQSVTDACNKRKFSDDEAVLTSLGWLIAPQAAKNVWGYRIEGKNKK